MFFDVAPPMKPVEHTYKVVKRLVVTVVGISVLLVGLVLIFIPGPAILVVPLGLAILSVEYAWARNWLKRIREKISAKNVAGHAERAEQRRGRHPGG